MERDNRVSQEGARNPRRRSARLSERDEGTQDDLPDRDERAILTQEDPADDDRYAAFLGQIESKVLPDLPNMPGYHVCWASTTSKHDTIPKRIQMGYEFVKPEMLQGWGEENLGLYLKSETYQDVISLNEMIAMRIPERLFQRFMRHLHHTLPISEEEKIKASNAQLAAEAEERGGRLMESSGMTELVQRAPEPRFVG
jgi:hypothetical protein